MSGRLITCRKCKQHLSLANYNINYNTGALYTHCINCKNKVNPLKKKTIKTHVECTKDIKVEVDEQVNINDKINEDKEEIKE